MVEKPPPGRQTKSKSTDEFFHAQKDESRVKTDIVEAYFVAWARILGGHQKQRREPLHLGYVDLFAGPGCYDDGTETTPVRILSRVLDNEDWRNGTLLLFNERNPALLYALGENVERVQQEKGKRLGIEPIFHDLTIDSGYSECLSYVKNRPTLFFVDPWGYVGITLRLLRDLAIGFGNDLIFFFNYRRVRAAVSNDLFKSRMDDLFGSRSEALRRQVGELHGVEREGAIVDAISSELAENVAEYVQRFRFGPTEDEASHYLFFVSKSRKGHELMTNIMAKRSHTDRFGVPTFEFTRTSQSSFFAQDPIETLADRLLKKFAGRELPVRAIFDDDSPGKQLQIRQYKTALLRLEARGQIESRPDPSERRPGTLADHVTIRFPREGA
jgi:three-Cys-motif partner protein